MNPLTIALIFSLVLLSYESTYACNAATWTAYKVKYQKQYSNMLTDMHHRIIFCDNLKMINEHNERYKRGEVTYTMGVNQFADWTHDEFKQWLSGGKTPQKY